jgi:DNA uptake protein ComE-like DNA-binding protein
MTAIKKWLHSVLAFSRVESNAFVILLPLVAVVVFSEPFARWYVGNHQANFSKENNTLDSLTASWSFQNTGAIKSTNEHIPKPEFFAFDPNTASVENLRKLGFANNLALRIRRYSERGGKFRVKTDLKKIYGMDTVLYQQLHSFILLPERNEGSKAQKPIYPDNLAKPVKTVLKFDVNKADTTQLKSVYGIGKTLAARIVKYRERLGGFTQLSQLNEVYGLDTTVINQLNDVIYLDNNFQPTKIDINVASQRELEAHPYVTRPLAKAIMAYRFQHGKFTSVEDIRKLHSVNQNDAEKIIRYLKVE